VPGSGKHWMPAETGGNPVTGRHVLFGLGLGAAAVLEYGAGGFVYRSTDNVPADEALARWAAEVVPAVRDAIAK
jgi:hypothetical protein